MACTNDFGTEPPCKTPMSAVGRRDRLEVAARQRDRHQSRQANHTMGIDNAVIAGQEDRDVAIAIARLAPHLRAQPR